MAEPEDIFLLKEGNTLPVLQVVLKDPDGVVFDLTGQTAMVLRITLSDGTVLTRNLSLVGLATAGTVKYAWLTTDWDAGNLVAGPTPPVNPGVAEHRMEYEITTAAGVVTFPNDGYHVLRIWASLTA